MEDGDIDVNFLLDNYTRLIYFGSVSLNRILISTQ